MSTSELATEESKTTLENSVGWYLNDKLADAMPIATKKYLTGDNLLVYLTQCNVAEQAVPRIKVQVFKRVDGGVNETGYQLFNDHRFEKYENNMIFGSENAKSVDETTRDDVTETEMKKLLDLVSSLQTARQTL